MSKAPKIEKYRRKSVRDCSSYSQKGRSWDSSLKARGYNTKSKRFLYGSSTRKQPWRYMHCLLKTCRGTTYLTAEWEQYGDKRLGMKRRLFIRRCVRCGMRMIDRQCQLRNQTHNVATNKAYNRKYEREGFVSPADRVNHKNTETIKKVKVQKLW